MKKLVFILLLFCSFQSIGQNRFPSIDSAKNYTLRYIRNSTMEAFTNYRLQNVTYGTLELLDSLISSIVAGSGVDSVWASSSATKDSIKYRKEGVNYTAAVLDKASLRLLITDTAAMLAPYALSTEVINSSTGGDTTVFEVVLDSTGQQNNRVLYAKNNKIASDSRFLWDETNRKLVIGNTNVSVGGPNTKLFVNGNTNIGGTTTTTGLSVGSLTGILKGTSGTVSTAVAGTDYQAPLISGTNIKTINGSSILGSGDLVVSGGGSTDTTSLSDRIDDAYNEITSPDDTTLIFIKPNGLQDTVIINGGIDTMALASFGAGSGAAGDTIVFSTSAIYGSFYNSGSDTLVITSLQIGLQGTSPDITTEVFYNDSLNVSAGALKLVTAGNNVTGIYGLTTVSSFNNRKIPPGNWVWVKTSAVAVKPTYFSLTLIGYKSRR